MNWNHLRQKIVISGAKAAGPLMAVAALASMTSGATVIGTLGGAAANFLLDVGANWAADESRDYFSRPVDLRFNHHLKRAMAEALGQCLADDATHSVTLLHALRDAPLNQGRLADLVLRWRNRVEAAIASEGNELIDALFPPMDQATLSELSREVDIAPRPLWEAFYEHALARDFNDTILAEACGGAEMLREHVPAAMAAVFPGQLSEALKRKQNRQAWIAFQKQALEQIQDQLAASEERTAALITALLQHVDKYVDGQLQVLGQLASDIEGLTALTEGAISTLGEHTVLLDAIRVALRREHDPPLYTPRRDPDGALGVRALKFSEQVVPLAIGRERELAALEAFLDAPQQFLWWGVVAGAGMGKSHLALQLVLQRQLLNWNAGFLESGESWIGDEVHLRNWQPVAPTLIVIDYASAVATSLVRGLSRLRERDFHGRLIHPVRLLLLDRPGGLAPAFSEIMEAGRPVHSDRQRVRESLYKYSQHRSELPLPDSTVKSREYLPFVRNSQLLELGSIQKYHWRAVLQNGLKAFGDNRALPDDSHPIWAEIAEQSDDGRPLLLLIIARVLSASDPFALSRQRRDDLLVETMQREREEVWADAVAIDRQTWRTGHLPAFERGVALVTLLRGLDWSAERERRALLQVMEAGSRDVIWLRDKLASITGWDAQRTTWLRPLEPDLFGEFLLADGVKSDAHGDNRLCAEALMRVAMDIGSRRSVETLRLMVREFRDDARKWLLPALQAYPPEPTDSELTIEGALRNSPLTMILVMLGVTQSLSNEKAPIALYVLDLVRRVPSQAYATVVGLFGALSASPSKQDLIELIAQIDLKDRIEHDRIMALCASEAMIIYGDNLDYRSLEAWGERMLKLARRRIEDREIQFELVRCANNAMIDYARARLPMELERWGEHLVKTATDPRWDSDRDIQLSLAKGAFGAIAYYGSEQNFEALEHWGKRLMGVANGQIGLVEREIQVKLAHAAVRAIWFCGKAAAFEALELWGTRLVAQAKESSWREDSEIQLALAQGASNAIVNYCRVRAPDALESWGKCLAEVASTKDGCVDPQIQSILAQCAVRLSEFYINTQRFDAVSQWTDRLYSLIRGPFSEYRDIQLAFVRGTHHAIIFFAHVCDVRAIERWADELLQLARSSFFGELLNLSELLLALKSKSDDVRLVSGAHQRSVPCKELYSELHELMLALTKCAVHALTCYRTLDDSPSLNRWGIRLVLAASQPIVRDDLEIQREFAKGALNALRHYADANDFEAIERWLGELVTIAQSRIGQKDREIQFAATMGYGVRAAVARHARGPDFYRWKQKFDNAADREMFKSDLQIAQLRRILSNDPKEPAR